MKKDNAPVNIKQKWRASFFVINEKIDTFDLSLKLTFRAPALSAHCSSDPALRYMHCKHYIYKRVYAENSLKPLQINCSEIFENLVAISHMKSHIVKRVAQRL